MSGCYCGDDSTEGVMHRKDGPCYQLEQVSEHTKEPWQWSQTEQAESGLDVWLYSDAGNCGVGWLFNQANARRIVACVNKLAGIPLEDLESDESLFAIDRKRISSLEAQLAESERLHRERILESFTKSEQIGQLERNLAAVNEDCRTIYKKADQHEQHWEGMLQRLEAQNKELRELLQECDTESLDWLERKDKTLSGGG